MITKVENKSMRVNEQWSVYYDMKNKLVIQLLPVFASLEIDEEKCDPDGIPLVFLLFDKVTRVRKMTDKEFEDLDKENKLENLKNVQFNIVYKVAEVSEKKEKSKDKEKKNG